MAIGDVYTDKQIDEEIDKQLPRVNAGKELPIARETARAMFMAENMGPTGAVTFANLRSSKNATGVSQVIPDTIRGLKAKKYLPVDFKEDLAEASLGDQVLAGLAAIREMADTRKTNDPLKLAVYYNAGGAAGNAFAAGDSSGLPKETQGYLGKIKAALGKITGNSTPLPPTPGSVTASPAFQTTPLTAANAAQASYMQMMPQVMEALFDANQVAQEKGAVQREAIQKGAEAAGQAAATQAEITIQEQAIHGEIMSALGLDVRDPNSAIRQELEIGSSARMQREKISARVAELQGKSLFSDPLGYLMAIPELQSLVPQHNQLVDVENTAAQQITRMQQVALQAKSLTPAKSADLLRAKATTDANAFMAKAQEQAATSTAANAAGNAKLILDMFTMQRNVFADTLALEGREEAIKDRRERAATKAETDAERAAERQRESALLLGINSFRKAISGNVPDYTPADIKSMPAQLRSAWHEVVMRGNFGNSYAESVPFIDQFGNMVGAAQAGNAAMAQLIRNIKSQAYARAPQIVNEQKMKNPMARIDDKTALLMAFEELYSKDAAFANKGADKSTMSPASPYAIDYDAIAAAAKTQKTDSIVSKVLLDAKARMPHQSINAVTSARTVMEAARAEVLAGTMDPAKAARQISTFYKAASDNAYEAAGLKYVGLPRFIDYTISPGDRGGKKVDLFNQTQVENYLTAEVASKKRQEAAIQNRGGVGSPAGAFFPFGTDPFGINK